jgi:glycerol kinase
MAKNTYGTASNFDVNIGDDFLLSGCGLQTTIGWGIDDRLSYALEGGVYVAGAVVEWMRDRTHFVNDGIEANKLALSVPDTDGVYLVPAFVGLGAPHWDPYARGAILGLSNSTRLENIVRAGMESIAYQVNDIIKAAEVDLGCVITSLRTDGGICQSDFVMQFQADISGIEVVRPKIIDTTALGAALLAGLYCGFWNSQEEIAKLWKSERVFLPSIDADRRKALSAGWTKAVSHALHWAR